MNGPQPLTPGGLLASRRHLTILLLILAVISFAGAMQARRAPIASSTPSSHLAMYAVLIGLQLIWTRYVQIGMKAKGHTIAEFLQPGTLRFVPLIQDVAFAIATLLTFRAILVSAKYLLGGVHARNDFLLPHGAAESALWVLLSLAAGCCEELVFRGYLQRQLAAVMGSVGGGIALQAVVFGVSHGYQGWRATTVATTYGLVFGLIAWWRGNVRAGIIAHAVTDMVAGLRLL